VDGEVRCSRHRLPSTLVNHFITWSNCCYAAITL
jgi:hypothetical protein